MRRTFNFIPLLLGLLSLPAVAGLDPYGTYGLYPQGNRRVTGMGGAFVGLSDDVNGILYNPAGLVLQKRDLGFGANFNQIRGAETANGGTTLVDGVPYRYLQIGMVKKFGDIALGFGANSPYSTSQRYTVPNGSFTNQVGLGLTLLNFDFAAAYSVIPALSMGVTFHLSKLFYEYSFSSTDPSAAANSLYTSLLGFGADFGISIHPSPDWGLGFAVSPGRVFSVDSLFNTKSNSVWFRDILITTKLSAGATYRILENLIAVLDVDVFAPPGRSLYVGSEVVPQFPSVLLDNAWKVVPHGGVEWRILDVPLWEVVVRGGTYYEPNRLVGGYNRMHFCAGVELRFWALAPSAAIDLADRFQNYTVGLTLSLKPFN